ncbi:MAG: hypothetical protein EA382_15340 [Spirochaetaceae bacterium]|nr:MAG: hypothetical protein EA382_15340 [Spirochaetaceae bacterium]
MSPLKHVRDWSRSVIERVRSWRRPAEEPDLVAAHSELLRRYGELAREIASHREYEAYVTGGVDRDSPFVKRFQSDEYARRLCDHFLSSGFVKLVSADGAWFALPIAVLFPGEEIEARLGWGLRRKLFNALFLRIAAESRVPIDELSKRYFERVYHTGVDTPGVSQQELLDGLQDALHELAVDTSQARRAAGMMPQLTSDETDRLLDDWLRRLRLESRSDLVAALRPGAVFAAGLSTLILLVASIALVVSVDQVTELIARVIVDLDATTARLIVHLTAALTIVAAVATALRAGSSRRGRVIRSTVESCIRTGLTSKEFISGYFERRHRLKWPVL